MNLLPAKTSATLQAVAAFLFIGACSSSRPPSDTSAEESGGSSSVGGNEATGGADAGTGGTGAGEPPLEVTVTVTLDPALRYQTLEGFGASLAWYQELLLDHPQQAELYAAIFAELGLDILRFRNRYQRANEAVDLGVEKALLDAATASLGRRPKVLLTSWSPPAALKENGDERCVGEDNCTLRKEDGQFIYTQFGGYWADSLHEYAASGIEPDWISIQNEPEFIPHGWEGCKFTFTEGDYPSYGLALTAVSNAIAGLPNRPELIGAENLGAHYNTEANFQRNLDQSLLHGVAHHLYELGHDGIWDWRYPGPDSYIEPMKTVVAAAGGKPIFMTEFQTDDDNETEGGFETAWLMHNSLSEADHVAWLYWDLVWFEARGLVTLTTNGYTLRDQYYSVRHYARFTDPGFVRIGASSTTNDIRVTAYESPSGDQLTIVALNVGTQPEKIGVNPTSFHATSSEAYRTVYSPGASVRWSELGDVGASPGVDLPPRSIVTIVLRR